MIKEEIRSKIDFKLLYIIKFNVLFTSLLDAISCLKFCTIMLPMYQHSIIPVAPVYGVHISHLIRYSRVCGSHQDFLDRGLLPTRRLLNQGFLVVKLMSLLRMFYGHHHDLVNRNRIPVLVELLNITVCTLCS